MLYQTVTYSIPQELSDRIKGSLGETTIRVDLFNEYDDDCSGICIGNANAFLSYEDSKWSVIRNGCDRGQDYDALQDALDLCPELLNGPGVLTGEGDGELPYITAEHHKIHAHLVTEKPCHVCGYEK